MLSLRSSPPVLCTGTALAISLAVSFATRASADDYRPPEYGYRYGEVEGPRSLAMGGADRALGTSTSALEANPANLAADRVYHLEGLFSYDAKAHDLMYGGAVVDSYTSKLGLGLMATHSGLGTDSDAYQRQSLDIRAALGFPLADRLFVGVSGRYLRVTQSGQGPLPPDYISQETSDNPTLRAVTFDAGATFVVSDAIRISGVGYNLTAINNPLLPLMLGGGIGFKTGGVALEGDVVEVDKSTWGAWKTRAMFGGEYLAGGHYPLRLGYSYDQGTQRHALSGGIGYVDPQFAVEGGIRQEIAGPNDPWGKAFIVTVGVRYFYESAGGASDPNAAPMPLSTPSDPPSMSQ